MLLGTFATRVPDLRPSIIELLQKSLADEDDEVRPEWNHKASLFLLCNGSILLYPHSFTLPLSFLNYLIFSFSSFTHPSSSHLCTVSGPRPRCNPLESIRNTHRRSGLEVFLRWAHAHVSTCAQCTGHDIMPFFVSIFLTFLTSSFLPSYNFSFWLTSCSLCQFISFNVMCCDVCRSFSALDRSLKAYMAHSAEVGGTYVPYTARLCYAPFCSH